MAEPDSHKVYKSKEERTKEGITILRKMIEIGANKDTSAFDELKGRISEWIQSGQSWYGKIRFPFHERTAIVYLPEKASVVATLEFNVRKT